MAFGPHFLEIEAGRRFVRANRESAEFNDFRKSRGLERRRAIEVVMEELESRNDFPRDHFRQAHLPLVKLGAEKDFGLDGGSAGLRAKEVPAHDVARHDERVELEFRRCLP